jgi:hypothetical protein
MAGAGIWSFVKFRGQMPWIATTGITSWQTALKWTADCQAPHSGCQEYMLSGGNLRNSYFILGNPRSKFRNLWHTFEHGTGQETEFQLPPFYIESPPVCSVISF